MIEELTIRGLGVIDDATLPLGAGFTAITGETGAGKTMVVTALGLLLGERADSQAVRQGQDQAWAEGRFVVDAAGPVASLVADAGGVVEPFGDGRRGELLLARSVSVEGRSRAVVGGRGAPVGLLAELGEQLVAVHGQSEQLRLRSATAQREALDNFGGKTLSTLLGRYRNAYERWRRLSDELATLQVELEDRRAEAETLRIALEEIADVDPQPGEDTELAERAERLTNLEELRLAAAGARELLSSEVGSDGDVSVLLATASRTLERAATLDSALSTISDSVNNLSYLVQDATGALSSYLAELDEDAGRDLEAVQERRAAITGLCRKYGPTLDDVLTLAAGGGARLLELDGDDDKVVQLGAEQQQARTEAEALADELTALRQKIGEKLAGAVTKELAALAMPHAQLVIELTPTTEPTSSGRDSVALLLCPHAGAPARPLAKGASGGELSRVMLAIEVVLAGTSKIETLVFDEVDAGVGGAAAIEIGRRLAMLAKNCQVIVVTHLAQVAAFAKNHLSVVKDSAGAVTASDVRALEGSERLAEMARLLSGLQDSSTGIEHAKELLALADQV